MAMHVVAINGTHTDDRVDRLSAQRLKVLEADCAVGVDNRTALIKYGAAVVNLRALRRDMITEVRKGEHTDRLLPEVVVELKAATGAYENVREFMTENREPGDTVRVGDLLKEARR